MPKVIPTEEEKRRALEKAQHDFPGNKTLQELHYTRYLLEIEWKDMTTEEIQDEIRKAKEELKIK